MYIFQISYCKTLQKLLDLPLSGIRVIQTATLGSSLLITENATYRNEGPELDLDILDSSWDKIRYLFWHVAELEN